MNPVADHAAVKTFVQQTLGCGCPEAVFASLLMDCFTSPAMPATPITRLLVGHRLLIYLLPYQRENRPSAPLLHTLAGIGRQERRSNGYNRLRIVLLTDHPEHERVALAPTIGAIGDDGGRLFFHVLERQVLPVSLDASTGYLP